MIFTCLIQYSGDHWKLSTTTASQYPICLRKGRFEFARALSGLGTAMAIGYARKTSRGKRQLWGGKLLGGIAVKGGYAVEVAVATGQIGQPVRLHYGHDERVTAEQPQLLTDPGGGRNHREENGQNLNAEQRNLIDRLAELGELLY